MESVANGIEELELFLCDLIRQGVGHLKTEGYSFFEARAARLIDAQAPGLARLIRECASLTSAPGNWQEPLLNRIAIIYTIARSFKRLSDLPADMEADVLAAIGFNQSQEALLAQDGISDHWFVVGQTVQTEDRLRVQKSWLIGASTKRTALVLSFAHGTAPFDVLLVPGHSYEAELVFYPSRYPLRALVKSKNSERQTLLPTGGLEIESALQQYCQALSQIPWLEEMPLFLSEQTLIPASNNQANPTVYLADKNGAALPLTTRGTTGWQLLSFSSGRPLSVFGEFDGFKIRPLAAISPDNGRYLRLAQGEA